MKKLTLLIAVTSLLSLNAHSAMKEVSEPLLSTLKEDILDFSGLKIKSAFNGGSVMRDFISEPNINGVYKVSLVSVGRPYASFMVNEYVNVTNNNQAYVVQSEDDENWLCLIQNAPFNDCYKIIERSKNKSRLCLEVE